ncbi:unnamed protein product (macronuclear) [Paramecium tetraurelia]|uniref:Uncharacterized protein n=1 Tax=Paramecium tetraurelia TaxID=5888 RepID=A0BVY5_PARTE|nr:uncharacterized protein GSPATT00032554001 [Paramecium tetraurelia]CAK62702.1 unnamed protein product [Paramecium tetraurelia]|eukprot:XP_001430100.1 hypothetical protein (macronuclear) [Paramecium tetraurelia strain d4-2]
MFQSTPKLKSYASQQLLQNTLQQKQFQQPIFGELNPSTPQKFSIVKNLKVLNAPSQQTESSFRQSNSKRINTQESPSVNKENISNRVETSQIEIQLRHVLQENKKLNDLIQKLTREKQQLTIGDKNTDLILIKQRVERLESVIDQQSDEIEEWKKKYKEVCEQDQRSNSIEQMEQQMISVIEENEKINEEKLKMQQQIRNMEKDVQQLKYQIADQNNQIIAYEEERIKLLDQLNNNVISVKQPQQQMNNKDYFLEQISLLENNLSDLQSAYSIQVLDNQKLNQMIVGLNEELQLVNKQLEEVKKNHKIEPNQKFSVMKSLLGKLREEVNS